MRLQEAAKAGGAKGGARGRKAGGGEAAGGLPWVDPEPFELSECAEGSASVAKGAWLASKERQQGVQAWHRCQP
jgi:hypothetical protein